MDFFFIIILLGVIIIITCSLIIDNTPIKVEKCKSEFIAKAVKQIAINITENEFNQNGRLIFTKKGQYRADFLKEANIKQKEIEINCCSSGTFSDAFLDWVYRNHKQTIKRKDVFCLICDYVNYLENIKKKRFDDFLHQCAWITLNDFFEIKRSQTDDTFGAYIIYNESKKIYYVGQSIRMLFRINQHFAGYGNGDIYADYKYGDQFKIKIIKLAESEYSDLDKLERDLIKKYNAYSLGYNRTKGNNNAN